MLSISWYAFEAKKMVMRNGKTSQSHISPKLFILGDYFLNRVASVFDLKYTLGPNNVVGESGITYKWNECNCFS